MELSLIDLTISLLRISKQLKKYKIKRYHLPYVQVKAIPFLKESVNSFHTPSGMTMLPTLLQPENAEPPMLVTPSGIVISVKPLQPLNAEYSIFVTPFGIVMFAKL